jgi:hypothetical protein
MKEFVHPSTILIAGPTGCGKTLFVARILLDCLFSVEPDTITFVYGQWQWLYDFIKRAFSGTSEKTPPIEFRKEFTREDYEKLDGTKNNILVLDDQMTRMGDCDELLQLFTEGSHHKNVTVIYLVQNLFAQTKAMRTVSLNSHYIVCFANPRDRRQVQSLASQIHPVDTQFLTQAYYDATSYDYGYLIFDLRPETQEWMRYYTRIMDTENTIFYVPPTVNPKNRFNFDEEDDSIKGEEIAFEKSVS